MDREGEEIIKQSECGSQLLSSSGFYLFGFANHRMVEVGRGICVSPQPQAESATADCLRAFSSHVWNTEDGDFTVSLVNL